MSNKSIIDFNFDELSLAILEKEPSLENLRRKALIFLRSSIVALGRIEVVVDAMSNEVYRNYLHDSRIQMSRVASTTNWLNDFDFFPEEGL